MKIILEYNLETIYLKYLTAICVILQHEIPFI